MNANAKNSQSNLHLPYNKTRTHACTHARTDVCVCVFMCACVCVRVHIHMRACTHKGLIGM